LPTKSEFKLTNLFLKLSFFKRKLTAMAAKAAKIFMVFLINFQNQDDVPAAFCQLNIKC